MFSHHDTGKHPLHGFIYLFLMDILRLEFQNYAAYAEIEPGFAQAWLAAYIQAFREPPTGRLSQELIKKINKIATAHLSKKLGLGEYKKEKNYFDIVPPLTFTQKNLNINVLYSITSAGLKEFIKYWLLEQKNPIHGLCLGTTVPGLPSYAIIIHQGKLMFVTGIDNVPKDIRLFSFDQDVDFLLKEMKNNQYTFEINCMPQTAPSAVTSVTEKWMQYIVDEYNHEISQAKTENEKITAIVRHVQHITQLHPFNDGNIRTVYILLNKLLRDHGLQMTILINPNRFDCFSVSELVEEVKKGQIIFTELLINVNEKFTVDVNDKLIKIKTISCPRVELQDVDSKLQDAFISVITSKKGEVLAPLPSLENLTLFSASKQSGADTVARLKKFAEKKPQYKEILVAINEGNYNVALRKACTEAASDIVKLLLENKDELKIDVNKPAVNGDTALDCLQASKSEEPLQKTVLYRLLMNHEAKHGVKKDVSMPVQDQHGNQSQSEIKTELDSEESEANADVKQQPDSQPDDHRCCFIL